ncbi:MAG: hypothetical protein JW847_01625 [Candidatus Omnitrophica bacterium]|nr:hypothetical protein [Candidatus Omnitrophota bacterium]
MRKAFFLTLLFLSTFANALDQKEVKANPSFAMGDKLMCSTVQSSDKKDVGNKLTFIGLNGNQPEVMFESGMTFPYKKLFENERTLTLVLARESTSGAVDGFVIDKQNGKFSHVSAGLIPGDGVYSIATLGVCK